MALAKATDKAIAKELADVVRRVYNGPKREQLSVNYARQAVEESLKLEDGFLKQGDWKARSKRIILDTMVRRVAINALSVWVGMSLLTVLYQDELQSADADSPQKAAPAPVNKAKTAPKQDAKRRKKAPSPSDAESGATDASDVEDAPQPPAKKRRVAKASQAKKVISEDEEDMSEASEGSGDEEPPKPAAQRRSKHPTESESELSDVPDESSESKPTSEKEETPKPAPEDADELSDVIDEPPKRKGKAKAKAKAKPSSPPTEANNDKPATDDSDGELSSVLDEPPPPKRKRKSTKDIAPSKSTVARGAKSTTATDSPDEAQIKLLQSQLSKCGVRKVWAFEFKKCGADTPKAKIKHLKEMLADVGMTGRFSEAKAREIKEMRELQADLEDVMQGEKSWGVGGGGKGARRRAAAAAATARGRGLKKEGSEGEDDDEDEEEEGKNGDVGSEESDEGGKTAVRGKGPGRRRPDLAFLEDESESE
jgi:hypothetical protein